MGYISRLLVALLAPGACRLCESRLLQAVDYPVCEACLLQMVSLPLQHTCDVCGEPLAPESPGLRHAGDTYQQMCAACLASRPRFVRATAFGLYEHLRPAIRLLKFEGVPSLAKPLAPMLAAAVLYLRATAPDAMTVVPVPLYRGKRAYNQSHLLAANALHSIRKQAPGWALTLRTGMLRRTRPTESQFLLSQAQRRENLKGAFEADPAVSGLDILLIDDVYTTGATAQECTRVLLAAGAKSVHIATLARAGRDTAMHWRPMLPLPGTEAFQKESVAVFP